MNRLFAAMLFAATLTAPAWAFFGFGSSDEEDPAEVATRVAEALREPNRLILQAQSVIQAGDNEEGIRLFGQALERIHQIETSEDTSSTAWASLRIKKALCQSMLDSLALERAAVQDVRQAVTDTSDLEKRLAAERAELQKTEDAEKAHAELLKPPAPPTFSEQLPGARRDLAAKQATLAEADKRLAEAKQAHEAAAKILAEAQAAATAANAQARDAQQSAQTAQAQAEKAEGGLLAGIAAEEATGTANQARQRADQANAALKKAQAGADKAATRLRAAQASADMARQQAVDAQTLLDTLNKAIAKEKADAAAKAKAEQEAAEAEARRLEAATIARRQAQAAAEAKARELARKRAEVDRQTRAQAAADAQARKSAVLECTSLWEAKRIDTLEPALLKYAIKWPEEPAFMLLLARLRLLQGRSDDAIEIVGDIPAGTEAAFDAQLVAAGACLTQNRPDEAMRHLEKAAKARPKDPRPYFNMAVAFLRMPTADPDRSIAAKFYVKSVELGGKRSLTLERRLNME